MTFTVSDDGLPPLSVSGNVAIQVQNEPEGATQDVGTGGGTVTNESGTAQVELPPGALSGDTTITIEPHSHYALQDEFGDIIVQFEFGPAGLEFNEPVTIKLYYDPDDPLVDPYLMDIYYYNEDLSRWEPMFATVDEANYYLYVEVVHFSTFALVEVPTPGKIYDFIEGLPGDAFDKNSNQRKNAIESKLNAVDKQLKAGAYQGAINKLINDIKDKMDGKGKDWVVDSSAQEKLSTMIDTLVALLETRL